MSKLLSAADIMLLQTKEPDNRHKFLLTRQNSCCFVRVKTYGKGKSTSTHFNHHTFKVAYTGLYWYTNMHTPHYLSNSMHCKSFLLR